MIFDTHAHYDDHAFDGDRDEVLRGMASGGVGCIIDASSTPDSLEKVAEIAGTYDFVYGAAGLHPDEAGMLTPGVRERILELLRNPKFVAVGEIGLDYHWDVWPHEVQIRKFREQIDIALEADLPIIVHSRAASADTLEVIQDIYRNGRGKEARRKGVIHAFPGSVEMAKACTEMGFFLGIGGVLTYTTSKKLKKVVAAIPAEYLLLETDSPYLSPESKRGERNTSRNLTEVVRVMAEIKGVSEEEIERVTWDNAVMLFLDR